MPLTSAVELVRPLVLGRAGARAPARATLAAYAGVGYFTALVLTRRRYSAGSRTRNTVTPGTCRLRQTHLHDAAAVRPEPRLSMTALRLFLSMLLLA